MSSSSSSNSSSSSSSSSGISSGGGGGGGGGGGSSSSSSSSSSSKVVVVVVVQDTEINLRGEDVNDTNLVSKFIVLKRTNRDRNTYEDIKSVPGYIFKKGRAVA
jgi:hypothetical protein